MKFVTITVLLLTGCITQPPRPLVITVPGPHQTINCGGPPACNLTTEEKRLVLKRRARIAELKREPAKTDRR